MNKWLALILFVALALGGGTVIGMVTQPGPWYEALAKPWFNPPSWVFGPVWSVLYVLIGIAGWRVWRGGHRRALGIWWTQLAFNFAWSPAFFALQSAGLALVVVLALLTSVAAFIGATWNRDRIAASLFFPYLLWVAFASLLNAAIFWLN